MLEQDPGMKRSSYHLPPDPGFHGKEIQTQGPERSHVMFLSMALNMDKDQSMDRAWELCRGAHLP